MDKQRGQASQRLDEISTEWTIVTDPGQFVLRYGPAVQLYLVVLLKNRHDAEDVAQDFFVRVARHGFIHARRDRGRFRDYLKVAVRNLALNSLRRKRSADTSLDEVGPSRELQIAADQAWLTQWRRIILDRASAALERHERASPGNLFSTVLAMIVDNPGDDAKTLAERTSARIGRQMRPDAFRKQVSRARRMLARLIVREVEQTLDSPTPEHVKDELIELALWQYVRDYLPTEDLLG